MYKIFFPILLLVNFIDSYSQERKTFSFSNIIVDDRGYPVKNRQVNLRLSILGDRPADTVWYAERSLTKTDSNGIFHLEIGGGEPITGQFDSIIWPYGSYFLIVEKDIDAGSDFNEPRRILMREPPDLSRDYVQGIDSLSLKEGWGTLQLNHARGKRPRKVVVDLTTSYVNVNYPADTYPIYRHFEWVDPEGDGLGNAITISYSENTHNAFAEQTAIIGEVKLYQVPFQKAEISSGTQMWVLKLSQPIPVKNHGTTYRIKGPCSIIYYLEW